MVPNLGSPRLGTFGYVWRHFWLSQMLGVGGSTSIQWVKVGMLLNIVQCTGKSPTMKNDWVRMSVVPRLRSWDRVFGKPCGGY